MIKTRSIPSDCAPSNMMFTYTVQVSSKVAKGPHLLVRFTPLLSLQCPD